MAFFRRSWILVVAIILVVVIVAGFLAVRWALDPQMLKGVAESRLSQALGLPVTIGTVRVSVFPTVTVSGTNIGIAGGTREAGTSLTIDAIRIHPRVSSIFRKPIVIDRVDLDGLTLRARRDASGRLLLPLPQLPANEAGTASSGAAVDVAEVLLKNGRLTIASDRATDGGIRTTVLTPIDNMAATVHRTDGTTRLDALTASVGKSKVSGSGSLDTQGLRLTLQWTDLAPTDVPLVFALLGTPAPSGLSIQGRNPVSLDVVMGANGDVTANGKIAADRAALGTLTITDFRSPVSFAKNRLAVGQMAFRAYSGTGTGRVSANVLASPIPWTLDADLQRVDIDQFLSANTSAKGKVSGTGAVQTRLRGSSAEPVERTIAGTMGLSISNGVIRDFPLVAAVYSAMKLGSGSEDRNLHFQSLTGTFAVANARATTNDLTARSGDLTMTATGSIGFDQSIAMSGNVVFAASKSAEFIRRVKELSAVQNQNGELPIPFTVSGNAANPHFSIDIAGLMRRGAENELKKRLGDKLRDLFKKKK